MHAYFHGVRPGWRAAPEVLRGPKGHRRPALSGVGRELKSKFTGYAPDASNRLGDRIQSAPKLPSLVQAGDPPALPGRQ